MLSESRISLAEWKHLKIKKMQMSRFQFNFESGELGLRLESRRWLVMTWKRLWLGLTALAWPSRCLRLKQDFTWRGQKRLTVENSGAIQVNHICGLSLLHHTHQKRYLWMHSIEIYLALYNITNDSVIILVCVPLKTSFRNTSITYLFNDVACLIKITSYTSKSEKLKYITWLIG